MEFLGIGPSELLFIVIIALVVLGPRDMQKAGRTVGRWLRQLVTSDSWKLFQQTSREIQTLPNRLMREAALDELQEIQKDLHQPINLSGPNPPPADPARPAAQEPDSAGAPQPPADTHSILPPAETPPQASQEGDNTEKHA